MGEGQLEIYTEAPTQKETKMVVQTLKNGKARGIDQIITGLLKVDTESTCVELKRLFDLICKKRNCRRSGNRDRYARFRRQGTYSNVVIG